MSSGLKKRGSSGLMSETNGGAAVASCSSAAKSYFLAFLRPLAAAFLDQPEADDVFEQAHGIAEADFVGESEIAALVGDDGLRPFDAHERPGAGTQVGPVSRRSPGTAATAAPVSCEQDAMTSICGRPVSAARFFFIGPSRVPDGQMGANKFLAQPERARTVSSTTFWSADCKAAWCWRGKPHFSPRRSRK